MVQAITNKWFMALLGASLMTQALAADPPAFDPEIEARFKQGMQALEDEDDDIDSRQGDKARQACDAHGQIVAPQQNHERYPGGAV